MGRLLRQVHLAGRQSLEQLVGGNVDQDHLVRAIEERVGDRLPHADAGDATDDVVEALEMLDVERREDVDAGREQLLDVLPALRVARAGDVAVREFVDQHELRLPRQRGIEIEFLEATLVAATPVARLSRQCDHFERGTQRRVAFEQRLGLAPTMRLDDAGDDVDAFARETPSREQHRVGLADARRRAEVDPQPAASGRFLVAAGAREERVGVRPGRRIRGGSGHAAFSSESSRLPPTAPVRHVPAFGRRPEIVIG